MILSKARIEEIKKDVFENQAMTEKDFIIKDLCDTLLSQMPCKPKNELKEKFNKLDRYWSSEMLKETEGPKDTQNKFKLALDKALESIKNKLVEKNESYGNSAIEPVRIFSNASPEEQINVRIDDKLSRMIKGHEFVGDNDADDLRDYLVLKLTLKFWNEME